MTVVSVNPLRCRLWALHDRLEEHLTEEACKEQIASWRMHGQVVPALGRALQGDSEHDVEIIYGARRLFVARHLDMPLLVELRELSDREALISMDIENRQRVDISPYERGLSYHRWLRSGHFKSQGEIARELNVSASQVSRLLKLTRLPAIVLEAFGRVVDIREEWGIELAAALDDPDRRAAVIRSARAIAGMAVRPASCEVFTRLLAATGGGRKVKIRSRDEVVSNAHGVPVFRIRQQRNSLALLLPLQGLSQESLREIRRMMLDILQQQTDPVANRREDAQSAEAVKRFIQSELTSSD
jgi:ParB family chromosome partitioning protein